MCGAGNKRLREGDGSDAGSKRQRTTEPTYVLRGKKIPVRLIVNALMETMRVAEVSKDTPLFRGMSCNEDGTWPEIFCDYGPTFTSPDAYLAAAYGSVHYVKGDKQRIYRLAITVERPLVVLLLMDHVYEPVARSVAAMQEVVEDGSLYRAIHGELPDEDEDEDEILNDLIVRLVGDGATARSPIPDDHLEDVVSTFEEYLRDEYSCAWDGSLEAFNRAISKEMGIAEEDTEGMVLSHVSNKEAFGDMLYAIRAELPFTVDGLATSESGDGSREISWMDPSSIMREEKMLERTSTGYDVSVLSQTYAHGDSVFNEHANIEWNHTCERGHREPFAIERLFRRRTAVVSYAYITGNCVEMVFAYWNDEESLSELDPPDFLGVTDQQYGMDPLECV